MSEKYTVEEIKRILQQDVVDEVFIDSKGRLWVCTINGLNLYDKKIKL